MHYVRRIVSRVVLWGIVLSGLVIVVAAAEYWPAIVRHMAAASEDSRPGEKVVATPEKMRRAQEMWRKRRAEAPVVEQPRPVSTRP